MHLAFLIDPLDSLKPKKDSSLDLMVEASRRKHAIWLTEYSQVKLSKGELVVEATEVTVGEAVLQSKKPSDHVRPVNASRRIPIAHFDVVFIRKDPPFDSQYLALTYLLDQAEHRKRFVNSPRGIREVNEKLFASRFNSLTPSTLVTWELREALHFAAEYERVVLKPVFLGSGKGILLSSHKDDNFRPFFDSILNMEPRGPVIVQEYLPEGAQGDTRVMLLNGVPLAALGRRPAPGDFRANIAAGGEPFAVELTADQEGVARDLGQELKRLGIVFAGLDFIGKRLIEINVTSPTLIQELRRVSGFDMSRRILDVVEAGV